MLFFVNSDLVLWEISFILKKSVGSQELVLETMTQLIYLGLLNQNSLTFIMKSLARILCVVFFSFLLSSISYGQDVASHEIKKDSHGVESLSVELRELLSKEMLAIQKGMMSIIPAYASGNWSEIEAIADKMQNSYILKQSLTDAQVKELHTLLPDTFIKQDQHFHYLAGMLKHVAKNKKTELVGFYFSKLSEACLSCHTEHAIHKFPLLVPTKEINSHSH